MRIYSNAIILTQTDFVSFERSFSTAEIQDQLFYSESSPCLSPIGTERKAEGEFRLIGDELMQVDRVNLPPGATPPKENHALLKVLEE